MAQTVNPIGINMTDREIDPEKWKKLVDAEIEHGSVECGSRNIGLDMWISDNLEEIHISPNDYELLNVGWNAALQSTDSVLLPKELTAENGAKALLVGKFKEVCKTECQICFGEGHDDNGDSCEDCDGEGVFTKYVAVSWPTFQSIYTKIANHYSKGGV